MKNQQEELSAHRPGHDGSNLNKNGDWAVGDLIAQARELVAELEKLTPRSDSGDVGDKTFETSARPSQAEQLLLSDYNDVAMRIISQTPKTPGEMRAILTFFLEDEEFRAVADERVSILIRSLLQSSVLAGADQSETESDIKINSDGLLQDSGVPREEAMNEKRYVVCSDGRPITEVLNFVESTRVARDILVELPEANLSIYDTVTAIHYL
ncbi:hypothetical protein [Rhodoblastus sp.]|jgi:hypothetical protein|uniref:hypothetical protein n=1 Tax=Rhodoblastus sp. TaxID=1962975 RepID=UPI0025F4BD66|nr:hypothetical protein [Rhodoblastus sp.]